MWTWSEAPLKMVGTALGVGITLIGGTYKGLNFVDNHFAHQDDVELIDMRLNEKISSDRINQIQGRIWRLEELYGMDRDKWPKGVQQEVKELEAKKQQIERRLSDIDREMLQRGYAPQDIR